MIDGLFDIHFRLDKIDKIIPAVQSNRLLAGAGYLIYNDVSIRGYRATKMPSCP